MTSEKEASGSLDHHDELDSGENSQLGREMDYKASAKRVDTETLSSSLEGPIPGAIKREELSYQRTRLPESLDSPDNHSPLNQPSQEDGVDSLLHGNDPVLPLSQQSSRLQVSSQESPRDHSLYHTASLGPDNLYHCPWEGDPNCAHKPEKLKCYYEYALTHPSTSELTKRLSKYVDSHLKPYRCKVFACDQTRFSSTACLLRHEREAHSMHGHGEKPFLCPVEECERGLPGNGFPRHWNLCDHMKRMHNKRPTPPLSSPSLGGNHRSKKRKVSFHENGSPGLETATDEAKKKKSASLMLYERKANELDLLVAGLKNRPAEDALEDLQKVGDYLRTMTDEAIRAKASAGQQSSKCDVERPD